VFDAISKAYIEALQIPVPGIIEQQRVAADLDQVSHDVALVEQKQHERTLELDALHHSIVRAAIADVAQTSSLRTLESVCVQFGRGKSKHRPRNDPRLFGDVMPFVQTGDISEADRFVTSASQYYSQLGVAQSKVWPVGTVCVAIVGATIGESAILALEACFPDSVIGMVPDPTLADSEYLEYLLQYSKAQLKDAGKGSARDNINLGTFETRLFPIPDLSTQRRVVGMLNEQSTSISIARQMIEGDLGSSIELYQSLLNRTFSSVMS